MKYPKAEKAEKWRRSQLAQATKGSGVYVLWLRGTLIYVGASRNIRRRLRSHPIKYDQFQFVKTASDGSRTPAEKETIVRLSPPLNIAWRPGSDWHERMAIGCLRARFRRWASRKRRWTNEMAKRFKYEVQAIKNRGYAKHPNTP